MSWWPTKEAERKLNEAFRFEYRTPPQDWYLHVANPERLEEYISHFETGSLHPDAREALVAVIIGSFDGSDLRDTDVLSLWRRFSCCAEKFGLNILAPLRVWSDVPVDDDFAISSLAKELEDRILRSF